MEDNQGAIAIAKKNISHARTKHIDIRYHYVREAVQERTIDLRHCPMNKMITNLLTKPLTKPLSNGQFEGLQLAMGIDTMTAQTNCLLSGSVVILGTGQLVLYNVYLLQCMIVHSVAMLRPRPSLGSTRIDYYIIMLLEHSRIFDTCGT